MKEVLHNATFAFTTTLHCHPLHTEIFTTTLLMKPDTPISLWAWHLQHVQKTSPSLVIQISYIPTQTFKSITQMSLN